MKVLIGAVAAAALMLGSVADAQTTTTAPAAAAAVPPSRCPAAIAPPAIPDGATVDQRTMGTANEAFHAWAEASQEIIRCRHAEYDEAVAIVHAREAEYNSMRDTMNGTITAWTATSDTFCARRGNHCTNTGAAATTAHH